MRPADVLAVIAGFGALIVALLAWLSPFHPVGPSPIVRKPEPTPVTVDDQAKGGKGTIAPPDVPSRPKSPQEPAPSALPVAPPKAVEVATVDTRPADRRPPEPALPSVEPPGTI